MLGSTLLLARDRAGAIGLFERGLAAAQQAGVEAYLLRATAPLAAATGARVLLAEAAGLLERAGIPDGGAWMLGYEAYLSLAEAWLAAGEPERARAVLAPVLAVADREPWIPGLAGGGRGGPGRSHPDRGRGDPGQPGGQRGQATGARDRVPGRDLGAGPPVRRGRAVQGLRRVVRPHPPPPPPPGSSPGCPRAGGDARPILPDTPPPSPP